MTNHLGVSFLGRTKDPGNHLTLWRYLSLSKAHADIYIIFYGIIATWDDCLIQTEYSNLTYGDSRILYKMLQPELYRNTWLYTYIKFIALQPMPWTIVNINLIYD